MCAAVAALMLVACGSAMPRRDEATSSSSWGTSSRALATEARCPTASCVEVEGVELVVSHVDLAASSAPNAAPLPAGQHYVAFDVSFLDLAGERVIDSSNVDSLSGVPLVAPTSLPGTEPGATDGSTGAAGIGLADDGGPVIGRTSQGSTGFDWHDGVGVGTECESALPVSSAASVGGGVIIQNGPTKTLEKGDVYGPVRLCFAVAGPVDQQLTVVWVPAPFAQGSPQPPTQYVILSP
jgi:hypothetical protein